jgi:photosystem II stability/assembly factor-like uncharacterized protein
MNYLYAISFLFFISCSGIKPTNKMKIAARVLATKPLSCRAMFVDTDKIWLGLDKGRFGFIEMKNDSLFLFKSDFLSEKTESRSIAATKEAIFILAVGNPAKLIKIDKQTFKETLVYEENHEKVFYDSMQFLDNQFGFAMGDPVENCLSLLKTTNGGARWEKISCANLPSIFEGEAAFATSNTNLVIANKSVFMVTGGKKARVFVSNDLGVNWSVYETPIIQGEQMTGIFTAAFYSDKIGIIAGGDYTKKEQNFGNKALTTDAGKTWQLIADNEAFGYTSCVQFVPKSNGKKIIAMGGTGLFYSADFGKTWSKFSDETELFTFRFASDTKFYATGKNKVMEFEILE